MKDADTLRAEVKAATARADEIAATVGAFTASGLQPPEDLAVELAKQEEEVVNRIMAMGGAPPPDLSPK